MTPALLPFVGRSGPRALFDATWASVNPQGTAVIVFHGIGGIGKTRLLRELDASLASGGAHPARATIDFADRTNHTAAKSLERARVQYARSANVSFPSFDIAFSIYWALANPGTSHSFAKQGFFDPGEAIGDMALTILAATEDLPGISAFVKLPRWVYKSTAAVKRWWTERGEADLQALRGLTEPLDVAQHLPRLFAADLAAWSVENPTRGIALFADTLDHLYHGALPQTTGSAATSWFETLLASLRGALVIVSARTPPAWASPPVTLHKLESLSSVEADALLHEGGLIDPELRRVLAGCGDDPGRSQGVPLYLALALDAYHAAISTSGTAPSAADFSIDLKGLLDLILSYADPAVRAAVYLLAVPRTFDRTLFQDLVREFHPGVAATAEGLRRVTAFSFFSEREPDRFALHDLVRDAALELQDPDDCRSTIEFLLLRTRDILEAVNPLAVTDADRQALYDWIQYSSVFPIEDFLDQYWNAEGFFYAAGETGFLAPLRAAVAEVAEQNLGFSHPATLTAFHNHAYARAGLGDFKEAEAIHQRVYDARAAHPKLGPDHMDTLSSLNSLASVYSDLEQYQQAADHHRRVLEARERTLPDDHPHIATSLNNLGHALKELGRHRHAEPYYRRALRWREQHLPLGDPQTLTSINNLAMCLQARGDRPGAGRLFEQAYALATAHLAQTHPVRLGAANSLGGWHLTAADPKRGAERAMPYLHEAMEGRRATLPDAHPQTLRSVANAAIANATVGHTDAAEAALASALELSTQTYGPDYSLTYMLRTNLDAVRQIISGEAQ